MKTIEGLKNLKSISRGTLNEALQGKYVTLVGTIHTPYVTGVEDETTRDEEVAMRLRTLDKQLEELEAKHYEYKQAGLFKGTSQGYKRGTSNHYWQKGDYCLNWLTYYVIVTNHIIMVLKVC